MRMATITIARYALSAIAGMVIINAKAQTSVVVSGHSLTAGAGVERIKEDLLALSSGKLNTRRLAWSFSNNNDYRKKSIVIGFERGISNSAKNSVRSDEFILQYSNAFSIIKSKSGQWNNYTGYSISINPQYMRAGNDYSWASVNSISFYNSLQYSWTRSTLSLDIRVPLAGLGSRPDRHTIYKGSVNDMLYNSFSDLRFTSFHNVKAADVSIQYQKVLGSRFSVTGMAFYTYKDVMVKGHFLQSGYGVSAGLAYQIK